MEHRSEATCVAVDHADGRRDVEKGDVGEDDHQTVEQVSDKELIIEQFAASRRIINDLFAKVSQLYQKKRKQIQHQKKGKQISGLGRIQQQQRQDLCISLINQIRRRILQL